MWSWAMNERFTIYAKQPQDKKWLPIGRNGRVINRVHALMFPPEQVPIALRELRAQNLDEGWRFEVRTWKGKPLSASKRKALEAVMEVIQP
jgi:hypothetical protein